MSAQQTSSRILIIFAHPSLQKSRVNRRLIEYVSDIDSVTFHDLYEAYPDFHIEVAEEQKLLIQHDILVFHHPIFWFSTPAILKEWQDLVLTHGWAYGKEGTALRGKKLLSVITTGGRESLYRKEGYHGHTIGELLKPLERTAYVCGMEYLPPFVIHGTHVMAQEDIRRHGEHYHDIIEALRDGRIDFEAARKFPRINLDIKSIIME